MSTSTKVKEIWLPVVGFEKHYKVSNLGNVFSNYTNKILKPAKNNKGYLWVMLYKDKEKKHKLIHRLQAIAFIPNPLKLNEVNHKNGIKTDNFINNFEWSTGIDNKKHAIKTGLNKLNGEDNPNSKTTVEVVKMIRRLHKETDLTHNEVSKLLGVPKGRVQSISLYKTWKHVS